jgi:hypothetical protein
MHTLVNVYEWKLVESKFLGLGVMVFNDSFKKISVISWRSVLLVEGTRIPGENHWSVASHWQTWSHNVVLSTPHHEGVSNSQS